MTDRFLNVRQMNIPYEFICLGIFSQIKYTQQYTTWNLLLSCLQPALGIPPECLFLNSATTWCGFQYGATDGTKRRLMKRNKTTSVFQFLVMDVCAHYLPMLLWGYVVLRDKRTISSEHIVRQSAWVALYYLVVGKGFNCEKQYVKYPYQRQVFQAATTPVIATMVTNRLLSGNVYPLVGYLSYLWYGKDYLDISDDKIN